MPCIFVENGNKDEIFDDPMIGMSCPRFYEDENVMCHCS